MKNIIVGQSGGPTAVINSSLYGVISQAAEQSEINRVYGMIHGIDGFLKGHYMDLSSLSPEELQLLRTTPGAYLGSCRHKLPEDLEHSDYSRLFQQFEQFEIGGFFYIGGNDSMDTVSKLSHYAKKIGSDICIAGIPKTIDNDLVLTDHTPGFGSAAKFTSSLVREITLDSSVYDLKSVTIVEIMGRHAGWLTASSVLARKFPGDNPLLIYLPETDFDETAFLQDVKRALDQTASVVVCVSEGIHDKEGNFICASVGSLQTDTFGHTSLTGCGKYLENLVREQLGVKVRSIELNVTQRCSASHISETDALEAEEAGRFGVKKVCDGTTGFMVAFERTDTAPYRISCTAVDVNQVCNREKKFPVSWISCHGTDVTQEFINYVTPLIQGTRPLPVEHGLPHFAYRK